MPSRNPERRIPRQYQQPRPTVVVERRRSIWARVPKSVGVVAVGCLCAMVAPFHRFDDSMAVNMLERMARTTPSTSVVRLALRRDESSNCAARWGDRLRVAGTRGIVVVEPLDLVCSLPGAWVVRMSDARRDWLGRVAGWNRLPTIESVPTSPVQWVRPYAKSTLPSVEASSIDRGHIELGIVHDKIVLLTLVDQESVDDGAERAVASLAAALSPGNERRLVPLPIVVLLVAAWGVLWHWVVERRGSRWGILVVLGGFSLAAVASMALSTRFAAAVLPLASMPAAMAAMMLARAIPEFVAERRALDRATELVERAALMRLRGPDQIDDAEFYLRIAGLAEQWHPANIVLVAQLPPKKWHLVFWDNGSAGENLIAERRRDVRRTPYCDEQGLPTIRVVRNYLAVKEMPVLVVPLVALGEIEGYVFLCGDRAEAAFLADPSIAHRMSIELAMLMRRRRLGRATMEDLDGARRESFRARTIAAGALTVTEEMDLLGAMIREAPLGLLLADAFGNVRMIGRAFADVLANFGVALPAIREDVMVPPGSLTLLTVLEKLTRSSPEEAHQRLAELASSANGLAIQLSRPSGSGHETMTLRCRALRKRELSVDHVAGFVAVLSESDLRVVPSNVVQLPSIDDLHAFGLVGAIEEVAASANRVARRRVIFEPTTSSAQCIAKRAKLVASLKAFLIDAASLQSPVIVIREKAREVDLVIHDVDLGVPMGAVERVMNAPHYPPKGLESLGGLILAVEESHGSMRVANARGWGMRLVVRLHRARSVVMAGNSRHPSAIAVSEGLTRSSMAPPPNPRSRRPPPGESG